MLNYSQQPAARGASHGALFYFLTYFLLLLSTVIFVALLFSHRQSISHEVRFANNEIHSVALQYEIMTADFRAAIDDLELALDHAAFQRAITSHKPNSARSDYARELLSLLQVRGTYNRVCVFDTAGREIIRIAVGEGQPYVVPDQELGSVSSYYINNLMQLDSRRVYVSSIDATVENGQVLLPPAPVVHLGGVALDQNGNRIGMVLLDFSLARVFADLEAADNQYAGDVFLLNPLGYLSYGQWNQYERLPLLGGNRRDSGLAFPMAWERISSEATGQFSTSVGLYTFATVYPAASRRTLPMIGVVTERKGALKPTPDQGYWKIVSFAPTSSICAVPEQLNRQLVQICLAVLVVLCGGCALLAVAREGKETAIWGLKKSEAKWRSLVENAPNFIAIVAPDFSIEFLNRSYFGREVEEVVGMNVFDFIEPAYCDVARASVEKVLRTGESVSYESMGKGGESPHYFENYVGPVYDDKRIVGVMYIFFEVTARKQLENTLRQSEFFLLESQRASKVGSFLLDIESGAVSTSKVLTEILGIDMDNQIDVEEWLELVHPMDRPQIESYLKATVITGQRPFDHEYRIIRPIDGEELWMHCLAKLKLSDPGGRKQLIGVMQDITKRKQEEERRRSLLEQLHHAQRLETIGTLAGGIAHDFNNVLQAIHGYVDMSLEEVPEKSQVHRDLLQVMKGTKRAIEMVKQILAFSRHEVQERRSVQLNEIVREAVNLLRATLPAGIELIVSLDEACGPIWANSGQMHQVIVNLCTNAYHAMGERGKLTVRTQAVEAVGKSMVANGFAGGKCVRLMVSDTGSGMTKATARRVFEPFFTTKDVGKGTGLGLSVVHGIVAENAGDISFDTVPGEGTTFHVVLPVYSELARPNTERGDTYYKGSERILFVDDDDLVAAVIARMLTQDGYDVICRNDCHDALDTFSANPNKFDIVITDYTMPKMTGAELAKEVRNIRADTPLILMSGLGHLQTTSEGLTIFDGFVGKPIVAKELGIAIRKVMQTKGKRTF